VTAKPPTPQVISALLRKAGFAESVPGERWQDVSSGYCIGVPLEVARAVVVRHHDEGQFDSEEGMHRHVHETAPEMLTRYAEVIDADGWDVELLPGGGCRLIVTAREESR
jgi:hypothetical protein